MTKPRAITTCIGRWCSFYRCVLLLVALVSCGSQSLTPSEQALVGSWSSHTYATVFVFTADRRYHITDPSGTTYDGTYRVRYPQRPLQGNSVELIDMSYTLTFLHTEERFVIDYGDGLTSPAIFERASDSTRESG